MVVTVGFVSFDNIEFFENKKKPSNYFDFCCLDLRLPGNQHKKQIHTVFQSTFLPIGNATK